MSHKVVVAGIGMIPFVKPSAAEPYTVMGPRAIRLALTDAGIAYGQIQQVYAGYVYGDSTCGQRVAYEVGMTGVPVINVNNNCSTGSTALFLARQAIESGALDCALAVGFEQMTPGALGNVFGDRPAPLDRCSSSRSACSPPRPQRRRRRTCSVALVWNISTGTARRTRPSRGSRRRHAGMLRTMTTQFSVSR